MKTRDGRLYQLIVILVAVSFVFFEKTERPYAQITQTRTLQQMYGDLENVKKSIEATKARLTDVRDVRFLPDLYFSLAEFYIDQSRYLISIKIAESPKVPPSELDFTLEKKPKELAIGIFDLILERFPRLKSRDRALFYKAHELSDLARDQEMIRTYSKLIQDFPQSPYWEESQLILGNHFFEDKKQIDLALEVYQKIIARKPGPFTPLAYYKIAWVQINQREFQQSLQSFERSLKFCQQVNLNSLPEIYRKTDIRRDALVSMALPYGELEPKDFESLGVEKLKFVNYFQSLAPDLISYQTVLEKLAGRFTLKKKFIEATKGYLEVLRTTSDLEKRIEIIDQLYVSLKNSQKPEPVPFFVEEVVKTLRTLRASDRNQSQVEKIASNFEIYARDVATRQQQQAFKTKTQQDLRQAMSAYEAYLGVFPNSSNAKKMQLNLAETYYVAGEKTQAGLEYERLADSLNLENSQNSQNRVSEFQKSALESYGLSLKNSTGLRRLELIESRNGFREVGRQFLSRNKGGSDQEDIQFTLAKTFYDERNFSSAINEFQRFINMFPTHPKASEAANLILDSFNQKEDFSGLIRSGKALLRNQKLRNPELQRQIAGIVQQAQIKRIQTNYPNSSDKNYAENLIEFAKENQGSRLSDQALFEAFVTLRAKKDLSLYIPGERLLDQNNDSKYAKEVVRSMGQIALTTGDFRRAAQYFEVLSRKYPNDSEAVGLMKTASRIREYLADYNKAKQDFEFLNDRISLSRIHFLVGDWPALLASSTSLTGYQAAFWQGLAHYRLGNKAIALEKLRRMAAPRSGEEIEMAAHAQFLIAQVMFEQYINIQISAGNEKIVVQDKADRLKKLSDQLKRIAKMGSGSWSIASLYTLGLAYKEFSNFVKTSPVPAGLSPTQRTQYESVIQAQALKYQQTAQTHFKECLQVGEKFEVFSEYVFGCRSSGGSPVDETAHESKSRALANLKQDPSDPPEALEIRKKLYTRPNDVSELIKLAQAYTKSQDYTLAIAILMRCLELNPKNTNVLGLLGTNYLFISEHDQASLYYKKSVQSKSPHAFWGLAGLYKFYGYQRSYEAWLKKARLVGRPAGPLPELIRAALFPISRNDAGTATPN